MVPRISTVLLAHVLIVVFCGWSPEHRAFAAPVTLTTTDDDEVRGCDCDVGKTGELKTFDGTHLLIKVDEGDMQKTLLSRRLGSKGVGDPCQYQLRAVSENENMTWVGFSVGIHPNNPSKFRRNFAFNRMGGGEVIMRGQGGLRPIEQEELPYSWSDEVTSVDLVGNITSGYNVTSPNCDYSLTYKISDSEVSIHFVIDADYNPLEELQGICQNCNGKKVDDLVECSGKDVRDKINVLETISVSCAEGRKHPTISENEDSDVDEDGLEEDSQDAEDAYEHEDKDVNFIDDVQTDEV